MLLVWAGRVEGDAAKTAAEGTRNRRQGPQGTSGQRTRPGGQKLDSPIGKKAHLRFFSKRNARRYRKLLHIGSFSDIINC